MVATDHDTEGRKQIDADIQIMVAGIVQTDCQVCDGVTVSFLTHSFHHLWLWSFLLPSNKEIGAELLLGQALPQMGVSFRLAGGVAKQQE